MACPPLTVGYSPKPCKDTAGVSEYLITELENIDSSTGVDGMTLTSGIVTAIDVLTGKQFWRFKQVAEVANWKQEKASSDANGSFKYTPTVTLQINGIDTASQTTIAVLLKKRVAIIAKNNDGTYWAIGFHYGLSLTSSTDTGTVMSDFIGEKLTFTGASSYEAYAVDPTIIASLLSPAS